MSTGISPDKIWTSELNRTEEILSRFNRTVPVRFYDTTLRDGEQSVGVCFTPEEKFNIACKLSELGVSRIESGFPRVSADDTRAVKCILDAGLSSEIWGFSRAVKGDIDAHIELGTEHVLIEISTSDLKIEAYGFTRQVVLQRVTDAIRHAKDSGIKTVNFFAVNSTRSHLEFLRDVYATAIEQGADEVSVVDTIGVCSPEAVEWLIGEVSSWVGPDIPIHWHGHNDFGLATASAIAAVRAGARWVQGTINGMGERAGNADLCEVALALQCLYDVPVELELAKAEEASRVVQKAGGYCVDGWKPVVGEFLYTRESGAVANQFHIPQAIEPYSAEIVDAERRIVLGKKSGLSNIRLKGEELGLDIPEDKRAGVLAEVKNLGTKNARLVTDEEFRNIVAESYNKVMKNIGKVCVVGAGAIGSLLVGHLGTGVDVVVLTRREEHARALNAEGLRVSGKSELHAGVRASTNPADLGEVDLVIIAAKSLAVEACARMIQGHFPGAHILMIQNGLGCEEMVSRFGNWPIISGVTFMSGTRHSDTHVEYELDTATWMGPWAQGSATFEYVSRVAALFNQSGLKADAYRDLLPHQWSKLIFNSAINSISALTDLPHVKDFAARDRLEDLGHLVYAMMDEAKRIAAARGVTLADDPWVMNVNAVHQGNTSGEDYAHVPSMLDDVRNKRLTEIDWITGAIVREAMQAGMPAPYHETLYRLVKAHEAGVASSRQMT